MRKAQAATEYLLITALILVIFIPAILMFLYNIRVTDEDFSLSKLNKIGHDIVSSAIEVYYEGVPAKKTIEETIPHGVVNMTIMKDWSINPPINQLIFVVKKRGKLDDMVFDSDVNIAGNISNQNYFGVHKIVLEAKNNGTPYVNIKII